MPLDRFRDLFDLIHSLNLDQLTLKLRFCQIDDLGLLSKAIRNNKELKKVKLDLKGNLFDSIDQLADALQECSRLRRFELNLE